MCKVVGLTGPTGAGKSSVSNYLRDCGYEVLDCDVFAKQVMDADAECVEKLKEAFSDCFDDNKLNRKKLGKFVFSEKNALNLLNSIVNPLILKNLEKYIKQSDETIIVLDGATLIECGAASLCDCLIGVLASTNTRLSRIMLRDSLSETDAANRIKSQPNDDFYLWHCTHIVYNDSDLAVTCKQVSDIIKEAYHHE